MVSDLGSGMNYQKEGLRRLLGSIIDGKVGRLVITHKERLLRFGAELVFARRITNGSPARRAQSRRPAMAARL